MNMAMHRTATLMMKMRKSIKLYTTVRSIARTSSVKVLLIFYYIRGATYYHEPYSIDHRYCVQHVRFSSLPLGLSLIDLHRWAALLYYLYTDEIVFTPLRSQANSMARRHGFHEPPSCSPKSMYRLACKVCLTDPRDTPSELILKIVPDKARPIAGQSICCDTIWSDGAQHST